MAGVRSCMQYGHMPVVPEPRMGWYRTTLWLLVAGLVVIAVSLVVGLPGWVFVIGMAMCTGAPIGALRAAATDGERSHARWALAGVIASIVIVALLLSVITWVAWSRAVA